MMSGKLGHGIRIPAFWRLATILEGARDLMPNDFSDPDFSEGLNDAIDALDCKEKIMMAFNRKMEHFTCKVAHNQKTFHIKMIFASQTIVVFFS